jgi:hypothetical protein
MVDYAHGMCMPARRHHLANFYRQARIRHPRMCQGMVDPRFVVDYR